MYGDPSQARIVADLSNAIPAVALSQRHMPGHWQVVDYEIEGLPGRLLSAGPETDAPPVKIPLKAVGWPSDWLYSKIRSRTASWPIVHCETRVSYIAN